MKIIYGVLLLLCFVPMISACGNGKTQIEEAAMDNKDNTNVYTLSSTVGDVQKDPYFGDFGRLLFPVDRAVSEEMTLKEISSSRVYVWYNYIDPGKTVEIIQTLHDHAAAGESCVLEQKSV